MCQATWAADLNGTAFFLCGVKYDVRDFCTCTFFWSETSLHSVASLCFCPMYIMHRQKRRNTTWQPLFTVRLSSRWSYPIRSDVKMITNDCYHRWLLPKVFLFSYFFWFRQSFTYFVCEFEFKCSKSAADSHRQTTWVSKLYHAYAMSLCRLVQFMFVHVNVLHIHTQTHTPMKCSPWCLLFRYKFLLTVAKYGINYTLSTCMWLTQIVVTFHFSPHHSSVFNFQTTSIDDRNRSLTFYF